MNTFLENNPARWAALLVLVWVGGGLAAAETWRPHDHQATTPRILYGFTQPVRTMALAAEVAGRVEAVHVQAGETVAAADAAVVVIDDTRARLARDRTAAELATARAGLQQAQARLALAERDQRYYQGEVDRITQLAEDGSVRQSEFDAAQVAADRAAIARTRAQADVALAEASVALAQAAQAEAEDLVSRHRLHAPAGWVVVERLLEPGSVVAAGQEILRLARVDELAVELRLAEAEVAALRARSPLDLQFSERPGHPPAAARLHRVSPVHDPMTNKRLVELRLDAAQAPESSGGLAVQVTLPVADTGGLIHIPEAFLERGDQTLSVVDAEGNRHVVVPVRRNADGVVVTATQLPLGIELRRL